MSNFRKKYTDNSKETGKKLISSETFALAEAILELAESIENLRVGK